MGTAAIHNFVTTDICHPSSCLGLPFAHQPKLSHLFGSRLFKPPTWHSLFARLFLCSCVILQRCSWDCFPGFDPACSRTACLAPVLVICLFFCLTKPLLVSVCSHLPEFFSSWSKFLPEDYGPVG